MEEDYTTMVLTEAPICFHTQEGRVFRLYQPTLGKSLVLKPLLAEIGSNGLSVDGLLRTIGEKREVVCKTLSIYSLDKSSDVLDPFKVEERARIFSGLDDSDLVSLVVGTLSWPTYESVAEKIGIRKEIERKHRILRAKDASGSVHIGAVSVYGRLIDAAMERYGWSLQYTLWGISLANLQLLMSDVGTSVYLSKEEMKRVSPQDRTEKSEIINADDKRNTRQIAALFNDRKH